MRFAGPLLILVVAVRPVGAQQPGREAVFLGVTVPYQLGTFRLLEPPPFERTLPQLELTYRSAVAADVRILLATARQWQGSCASACDSIAKQQALSEARQLIAAWPDRRGQPGTWERDEAVASMPDSGGMSVRHFTGVIARGKADARVHVYLLAGPHFVARIMQVTDGSDTASDEAESFVRAFSAHMMTRTQLLEAAP